MKQKYFLILCLLLMGLASPLLRADTGVVKRHRTGLRKPVPREESYLANKVQKLISVQPNKLAFERFSKAMRGNSGLINVSTSAVINLQYLPPVGDQGQLGSCSAWASCYYVKTYQEAQEHGWADLKTNPAHQMCPSFGYNLANDGVDSGSDPSFIMQLMCEHGCPTIADMPVSVYPDYTTWPSSSAWKSAITYRADTASVINLSTNEGITALKQWLANGDIAVVGVEAYENLEYYPSQDPYDATVTISTNNVLYANSPPTLYEPDRYGHWAWVNTDEGGHAMAVIGYDDNLTFHNSITGLQESGAFLIVNQWGTSWGINISTGPLPYAIDTSAGGFIWMSYSYIKNLSTYQQAYAMSDRTAYAPTTFGTFALDHPNRGNLDVKFMGGKSSSSPDWRFDCLPFLGGRHAVNQQIYVDLTSLPINNNDPFWLAVWDSSGTSATGEINSMSVINPGGAEFTSADTPKETVKASFVYVKLEMAGQAYFVSVNLPGGSVTVNVPTYSFNVPVTLLITSTTAPSTPVNNLIFTGLAINVDSGGNQPVKLVTVTMFDNNLPSGIDKNRLAIAFYDSANDRWVPLSSTLGPGANEVSCLTSRLSCKFALVELAPSKSLSSVKAYPNPYKRNSLSQGMTIANLTASSEIQIYDLAGDIVRTIKYSNGSGLASWDGRNDAGNLVASGVYVIFINSPEGTQKLKVAVEK